MKCDIAIYASSGFSRLSFLGLYRELPVALPPNA